MKFVLGGGDKYSVRKFTIGTKYISSASAPIHNYTIYFETLLAGYTSYFRIRVDAKTNLRNVQAF